MQGLEAAQSFAAPCLVCCAAIGAAGWKWIASAAALYLIWAVSGIEFECMAATQAEMNKWAAAFSSRLKLLQSGCADEPAVRREQALGEEIKRAVNDLTAGERKAHLEALTAYFPAWGVATAPAPVKDVEQPPTAAELVEQLVESLRTSPDAERQQVALALKKAGLVVTESTSVCQATEDLQRVLGVASGQRVDPDRMARLLAMLAETVQLLDKFAWGKWAEWSPTSTFGNRAQGSENPLDLMCRYLTEADAGKAETKLAELNDLLGKDDGMTTKLVVEILVAVGGKAGMEYGQLHLEKLSPDAIINVVPAPMMGNADAARWRRYSEMSKHYSTKEAIAKKIRDCVVKEVEQKLTLTRRRPQRN